MAIELSSEHIQRSSQSEMRKRVLERFARLFERQVRMHQFSDSINDLVQVTHTEILNSLRETLRRMEQLPLRQPERAWIGQLLESAQVRCNRLEKSLELLLGERERIWVANGDDLKRVMLETNSTAREFAATLVEKSLLERHTSIIENIALSHEKVTRWKSYIQEILTDFLPLMPVSFFFIATAEKGTMHLYIYYMNSCTADIRKQARTTLAGDMLAQLRLPAETPWEIEEFQVGRLDSGSDAPATQAQLITAPVPSLDTSDSPGLLGTSTASVGCLTTQEASIVRSILAVMVMVVASSKALNRTLSELEYYSSHDPLTGLHNRRRFNDILAYEIDRSERHRHEFALIMLDLDDFKEVNDTYGHPCGDTVLQRIAEIMRATIRKGDFATRIGGDEFAILLAETGIDGAKHVAEKVRRKIRATEFLDANGRTFHITASIGLVSYPHDASSLSDLLAGVDLGMYRAKKKGKDGVATLESVRDVIQANRSTRNYAETLRACLKDGRVVPHYQPIVDCRSGETIGYETLARMRDASGELISAGMFIETMEKYGLDRELDRVIISQSLAALEPIVAGGDSSLKLFINLSAQEIQGRGVLGYAEQLCLQLKIPPQTVVFEIMERDAIGDMAHMRKFLTDLRENGFLFALDDFGSGYNSFHYLRELSFDYVKIDGAFVKNIMKSTIDRALVKNLSCLCQDIGTRTIAEFVESEELLLALREMNIDYAQGFHLGRPAASMG